MTKSLMISIQPQHAVNILNGKKTLELRTWIPKDYVGWVYVYCTKEKNRVLLRNDLVDLKSKMYVEWVKNYDYGYLSVANKVNNFNENPNLIGKVVARFWFDEYEKISLELVDKSGYDEDKLKEYESENMSNYELQQKLCLDEVEIDNYLNSSDGYAWHIKKLEIFDEPKELRDFYKGNRYPNGEIITPNICEFSPFDYDNDLENCLDSFRLTKAPQRSVWVYTKENDK